MSSHTRSRLRSTRNALRKAIEAREEQGTVVVLDWVKLMTEGLLRDGPNWLDKLEERSRAEILIGPTTPPTYTKGEKL